MLPGAAGPLAKAVRWIEDCNNMASSMESGIWSAAVARETEGSTLTVNGAVSDLLCLNTAQVLGVFEVPVQFLGIHELVYKKNLKLSPPSLP